MTWQQITMLVYCGFCVAIQLILLGRELHDGKEVASRLIAIVVSAFIPYVLYSAGFWN